MTMSVPVAAATAWLRTRAPGAFDTTTAIAIALPLAVAALALLLPVWYLCRAMPPESTWSRLIATHAPAGALAAGAIAYVGVGLARVVASWRPEVPVAEAYARHLQIVFGEGALLYVLAVS